MIKKYFFEIPIYRCNQEKYIKEIDQEKKRLKGYYTRGLTKEQIKAYNSDNLINRSINKPQWKYNEIVGFINLYKFDKQIRGDLFFINNKKISHKTKTKKFIYLDKVLEIWCHNYTTNQEIQHALKKQFEYLKKETKFKNRHIDLTSLEQINDFIKWKKLLDN